MTNKILLISIQTTNSTLGKLIIHITLVKQTKESFKIVRDELSFLNQNDELPVDL